MRTFFSLYASNLFLIAGTGFLTTFLAVSLSQSGSSSNFIGLLTSCYYLGLLAGAKVGVHFIKSVGHIRTFSASMAILITCVALHGLIQFLSLWLFLRFLVGLAMMCNYMVLESWLNDQVTSEKRGTVFSFYMITSYLGMMFGQYAFSFYPELGIMPILLICILLSLGVLPITLMSKIHPSPPKTIDAKLITFFKMVPQSLTAIFFAGVINGSFYGLAPIFAQQSGFSTEQVSSYMFITVLAGLLAQWPMGLLSDKLRRSILLRANAFVICVTSGLMFFFAKHETAYFLLTFIFGFSAFTIHPLSSALANSQVSNDQRVGVASSLMFSFGLGASAGVSILAITMESFGHKTLYISFAVVAAIMFVALTLINLKQKREQPHSDDYVVSPSDITASPMATALDPRVTQETVSKQMTE
jgi:MFS family permease